MRFIFGRPGNWTAFRAAPSGINNFMNRYYSDNQSAEVMELTIEASYVNEMTDDLVNGVADVRNVVVSIDIPTSSFVVGSSFNLSAGVFLDGNRVDFGVSWVSGSPGIVSIDEVGRITCNSVGSSAIKAHLTDNENVSDTIVVNVESVSDTPIVVISPSLDSDSYSIQQGDTQKFTCFLYINGVKQADEFVFTLLNSVPKNHYAFKIIDGNTFTVKNIMMYTKDSLAVTCTSGSTSYGFDIILKGAW